MNVVLEFYKMHMGDCLIWSVSYALSQSCRTVYTKVDTHRNTQLQFSVVFILLHMYMFAISIYSAHTSLVLFLIISTLAPNFKETLMLICEFSHLHAESEVKIFMHIHHI